MCKLFQTVTPIDLCDAYDFQMLRLGIARKYRDGKGRFLDVHTFIEAEKPKILSLNYNKLYDICPSSVLKGCTK